MEANETKFFDNGESDFKDALTGLRQFLTIEIPLILIKNAFCFTLKARFVLKIFKFLSSFFGHIGKRLDQKDKVKVEVYTSQPG